MSPVAAFSIAIGALTLIAVLGWVLFARTRKRVGEMGERIKALEEGSDAQERQLKAIREHLALGDLLDDERVVRGKSE